jgi:adenylate cyclase
MASPSRGTWQRRGALGLSELLQSWWRHRVSFLISVVITLAALSLYILTFVGERPTPIFEFVQRIELNSLDTRFQYRPRNLTPPDPRIVIVDIDQKTQEELGRWPFSRSYFARLLDVLHADGAKVAAFDVTFSKAEHPEGANQIDALLSEMERRKKSGEEINSWIEERIRNLAERPNPDEEFAAAIKNFGAVVLGNFFLYTPADLRGLDDATLDKYADELAFFSFPTVMALHPQTGKQDRVSMLRKFGLFDLLPRGTEANLDLFTSALGGEVSSTGFFNVHPDADGVVRRAALVTPFGRSKDLDDWDLYASLDVQSVRAYLRLKDEDVRLVYASTGVFSINLGSNITIKPDELGRVWINYRGPANTYPHYSLADVIAGRLPPQTFANKLVLIGATATGIGDLRSTPYGGLDYPGVEIHANVIDNIFNHGFLIHGPKQALWDLLLIFLFGIPLGIWMALVSPRWMWFGASLLVPLAVVDYAAFLHSWWLNFTVPAMTLTGNVLLVSLYRALVEEKEKRRVRTAFGQYLSPEVIRRLLVNPRLVEPKKTEITVMFSDIRGFTTISENLDAQELALFLNQYLSDMTRIVFNHHGTLDKYIGDAVMAFWGAPFEEAGHATRACDAALEMMNRVRELEKQWKAQGKPSLEIGIGLNTGVASVGEMGSVLRKGYTALGDTVNLSSRLEGLNKDYDTLIIANETTYASAKDAGFVFRELDLIRVKGKLQPVTIYELLGRQRDLDANGASAALRSRLDLFAQGRGLYRKREWAQAQEAFQRLLDKWPEDGPARTYQKRCQEYLLEEPPSVWDGVHTMTHK